MLKKGGRVVAMVRASSTEAPVANQVQVMIVVT